MLGELSIDTAGMALDDVVQVEWAAGCGHRLHSDWGPVECPCHWPVGKVARVARKMAGDYVEFSVGFASLRNSCRVCTSPDMASG